MEKKVLSCSESYPLILRKGLSWDQLLSSCAYQAIDLRINPKNFPLPGLSQTKTVNARLVSMTDVQGNRELACAREIEEEANKLGWHCANFLELASFNKQYLDISLQSPIVALNTVFIENERAARFKPSEEKPYVVVSKIFRENEKLFSLGLTRYDYVFLSHGNFLVIE